MIYVLCVRQGTWIVTWPQQLVHHRLTGFTARADIDPKDLRQLAVPGIGPFVPPRQHEPLRIADN
jgi:hypothetical protein